MNLLVYIHDFEIMSGFIVLACLAIFERKLLSGGVMMEALNITMFPEHLTAREHTEDIFVCSERTAFLSEINELEEKLKNKSTYVCYYVRIQSP